jgi:hypothetical protein
MSTLQHDRIEALAVELRLTALPHIYGAIAQAKASASTISACTHPAAAPGKLGQEDRLRKTCVLLLLHLTLLAQIVIRASPTNIVIRFGIV